MHRPGLSAANSAWKPVEGIPEFDGPSFGLESFESHTKSTLRHFDWRTKGVLLPVADQGAYQTCVAYSVCYCFQTRRRIAGEAVPALDPEMFHACVLDLSLGQANNDLYTTLVRLRDTGAPHKGSGYAPGERCTDFSPDYTRAAQHGQLSDAGRAKRIISTFSPIVALMTAEARLLDVKDFSIFRDGGGAKNYRHAVLIIGYDDVEQCWLVQNSLGTDWGDKGFGRIAYGSASILSDDLHRCYAAA